MATISVVIAVLSFCISVVTAWLTLFRRGRLAMTKPTIVFFGFDNVPKTTAKIFLRALLYSTAIRGQVIEGMFAKLHHGDSKQVFSFWGYGETTQLSPGSGLYVGQAGIAVNHHFVLSVHQPEYEFTPGDYSVEVFARVVGRKQPMKLAEVSVSITGEQAGVLRDYGGILFELDPDGQGYVGHAREGRPSVSPEQLVGEGGIA
jgi:hypothetical protein